MTTAHRPTFDPARGKETQKGPAYHQRLLPAHTHLKTRKPGQGGAAGLDIGSTSARELRNGLLEAEASDENKNNTLLVQDGSQADGHGTKRNLAFANTDRSVDHDDQEASEAKRRRLILEETREVDAESEDEDGSSEEDEEEDNDDDDDDDEEAELMRELAKVRRERAEKQASEQAIQAEKDQEEREREIAYGNPLLNPNRDFTVKRRWDDDVVFKNQARGVDDRNKPKEFVNDLLRSDFHKRFMSKYVR